MWERLAIGIIPGIGWRASEIQEVARAAEDSGFEAVFCTEVNNDSIATTQPMGVSTRRINVDTWVADVYLRVPYLCAKAAFLPRLRITIILCPPHTRLMRDYHWIAG